ncbi:conserved hypothetical protein [Theileria equi strain WA]|uniref:AP2/ERF domain-containing protein n=1 Tax=Theileria equi strain WA TaxID=1537102 RepID=L1LD27_THEEQ|nr:conserved hypothetical protein [Theileria equi strain WA]EKX73155.1 conserved hypothetical protein [Theileria equi strain WA]|eukprot:XP_004832607.1 conserved hypothetical protein [Theileria equi strain WA]
MFLSYFPVIGASRLFLSSLVNYRNFGTKRVVQKRKYMLKILHPEEKWTEKANHDGLFDKKDCLPKSLLKSSLIRRLLNSNTIEASDLVSKIAWDSYKSDVRGVRWHPSGSWCVRFIRRNHEHNFFVNCSCYFRVEQHGFFEAKRLAIAYRKRLEQEYSELEETWEKIDRKKYLEKEERKKLKQAQSIEERFIASSTVPEEI